MKVCMLSGTFPNMRCGVGDYTYRLCADLKKLGIEPDIITSKDPRVIKDSGLSVIGAIEKWDFLALRVLLELIKAKDPNLLHLQYPTQAYKDKLMINIFPVAFKRRNPGIPLVVTLHDVKTAHSLNKLRLFTFFFCAEKIILTAEEERQYLLARLPFLNRKLEVINVASSIEVSLPSQDERSHIRNRLGLKEGEILICHFGYLLKKKRIETVLYALRQLLGEGLKVKVVFISEFEPQRNRYHAYLKKTADNLNLNEAIVWAGYCGEKEISGYLGVSDIAVEMYHDGVSLRRTSFITAVSYGLPVVTTRLKGLPDGLREHYNVLTAAVGDAKGLAAAIKELIGSAPLRQDMGRNAKVFAARFSWQAIALKHAKIYAELL